MTGTHRTTITIPIVVHYELHQGCCGATDGMGGPPIEPDMPTRIEIRGLETFSIPPFPFEDADEARIIDEIAESLHEQAQARE